MRYLNILPRHKKCQFMIIYNSFSWCRHDRNCRFHINYRNLFLYDIKTHKQWQLKHQGVHLHGLDMRDTYTNSIINDNDGVILKHKMNRIR